MRRSLAPICAALIAMAALPFAVAAATAKPVFPPGLRVGLEPPAGLSVSHHFPGFEDAERHVVVAIFELAGTSYDQALSSAESNQQHGLSSVIKGPFPVAGGTGYLVNGSAQANGTTIYRWFLVAKSAVNPTQKDDSVAALIRVDVPQSAQTVYTDAVVRKMLASVSFRPTPIKELLGLLPFEIKDRAGMRVLKVVPSGAVLIDGPGSDLGKQPYAVVAIGRGGPTSPDLRPRFASDLLRSAPVNDLNVTSAEAMRISGMPGYEIRADAKGPHNEAIKLVQWLRFGTAGYLRVIGVTPQADWDKMFNRFRALRDGIQFR